MGSISIEGDIREFSEQMDRLSGLDKRKLNSVLAQAMRTSTLDRFKAEKDPDGKKWTQSARAKELGGKTLTKTASLKKSLHIRSTAAGFAVGTNLKYAATHQYGDKDRVIKAKTTRGLRFKVGGENITKQSVKITIPARPYLGINDDDIREILGTIEDFLTEE